MEVTSKRRKSDNHGRYCCVVGCSNRDKRDPFKFFPFPIKSKMQRKAWIGAVNRKNWEPKRYDRICGAHFFEGTVSGDPGNPSYAPSIFPPGHKGHTSPMNERQIERYHRLVNRRTKAFLAEEEGTDQSEF